MNPNEDRINDIKDEIQEIEDKIKTLEVGDNEDEYEDYLNDAFDSVSVCGYTYYQGSLLKEIDPIAFNCGLSEYNDNLITELEEEKEELLNELEDLENEEVKE